MTVGSLFSGIGGFDLGLERAGFEIKFQVEIDPFCRRVLEKHWPHVRRYEDVRTVHGYTSEPRHWPMCACDRCLGPVDVICGGDPCQANSNAGNVWKRQHDDLGSEFVRLVRELRPRIVVRENPTRTRADALWPWERFRDALESEGYAVFPFRLRSCCLGADHRRDRMFLLASLLDADGIRLEGIDWERFAEEHATGATRGDVRHAWADGLPAPRICRGADGIPYRMDHLRGLGNAVDPTVAEWIGRRIIEAETAMRAA